MGTTVRRNLVLGLDLRDIPLAEQTHRVEEVADECRIAHLLDRPARQLSGGEAQRANLARALALRAPVTLLDEPLAGLDRLSRPQLLDDLPRLLARFATTTVLVTHDREEAFRIAEHLVILSDGTMRAGGDKGEVYRNPPDADMARLLGYTVVSMNGSLLGIPPGALRLGGGPDSLELVVERVIDMGNHRHVLGTIGDTRADVRLAAGYDAPAPGAGVRITAESSVRFPVRPRTF